MLKALRKLLGGVEAKKAARTHAEPDDATDTMPNLERHR